MPYSPGGTQAGDSWIELLEQDLEDLSKPLVPRTPAAATLIPGERRSVAILFLDLEGFTSLSEKLDHEVLHRIVTGVMGALSGVVESHGGYVDKFEGDRIMALFGAQRSSEEDCSRAVSCATRMMQVIEDLGHVMERHGLPLGARAGVAFGDVTVAPDPSGHLTATGDEVNVASRMEETAERGTVQVSDRAMQECGDLFAWQDLGEVRVRNREKPVHTLRPIGPGKAQVDRWERAKALVGAPFVGRTGELSDLDRFFRADTGELNRLGGARHRMSGICGDAGIGKSRLAHEYSRKYAAFPEKSLVARATCLSYAQPSMWLFVSLFRGILGLQPGVAPAHAEVAEAIGRLRDSAGAGAASLSAEAVDLLSAMLSVVPGGPSRTVTEDEEARLASLTAVSGMLKLLSSLYDRVLLILEDAHWIDSASLQVLEFVSANCSTQKPLDFLLTYRPDPAAGKQALAGMPEGYVSKAEINLGELGESDSILLLSSLLGAGRGADAPSPEVTARSIYKAAGGNPFLLEEMALCYSEPGKPVISSGVSQVLNRPRTVEGIVRARIDSLPAGHRHLLQIASVIGEHFEVGLLGTLAGQAGYSIDTGPVLKELEARGFLSQSPRTPRLELRFRHLLTREATYGSILRHNRKVLHSLCARALAGRRDGSLAGAIAMHFGEAGENREAVEWGLAAAKLAAGRYDQDGLLDWSWRLESWLEREPRSPSRTAALLEVLQHREDVFTNRLARKERLETLRRMEKLVDEDSLEERRPQLLLAFGGYLQDVEKHREAIETNTKALEMFRAKGDSTGASVAMVRNGISCKSMGDLARASEWYEQALAVLGEEGPLPNRLLALSGLGNVRYLQGNLDESLDLLTQALDIARRTGRRIQEANILSSLGVVHRMKREFGKALDYQKKGLDLSIELGNRRSELGILNSMCSLFRDMDRLEEALEFGERALAASRELQDRRGEGNALCSIAILERRKGQLPEALGRYLQSLQAHREIGNRTGEAVVLGNLGNLYADMWRTREAIESYRQAADLHRKVGNKWALSRVLGSLAMRLLDEGMDEEAAPVSAECQSLADETENENARMLSTLVRARAARRRGDDASALDLAAEALSMAEVQEFDEMIAPCLIELAFAEQALGREGEALAHLREAVGASTSDGTGTSFAISSVALAELHMLRGEPRKAEEAAGEAEKWASATGDRSSQEKARQIITRARGMQAGAP
jgi:adenylate cyclase